MEDTIRRIAAVLVEISKRKERSELRLANRRGCRAMVSAEVHFSVMGEKWGVGGGFKGNTGEISSGAPSGQWRSSLEVLSSTHGGSVPTEVHRLA